jgi:hypothetical protein
VSVVFIKRLKYSLRKHRALDVEEHEQLDDIDASAAVCVDGVVDVVQLLHFPCAQLHSPEYVHPFRRNTFSDRSSTAHSRSLLFVQAPCC